MSAFAYVVMDKRILPDFKSRPFSFEIITPVKPKMARPRRGDQVWLLADGANELRVFGSIAVELAAELESNEILLTGSKKESCFISLPSEGFVVPKDPGSLETIDLEEGLIPLSAYMSDMFANLDRSNWKTTFGPVPPNVQLVAAQSIRGSYENEVDAEGEIERSLRMNFLTSELSFDPWDQFRNNPFSATARALLQNFIRAELVHVGSNLSNSDVDLNLTILNPGAIESRNFTLRSGTDGHELVSERLDSIAKLEKAEARHQEILLDCVLHLNRCGFDALASDSVDLAFYDHGRLRLFEIKSSNFDNFSRQFELGLIQIAKYRWIFSERGKDPTAGLIIELPAGGKPDPELESFASSLQIDLLYWNPEKSWPDRVSGLTHE